MRRSIDNKPEPAQLLPFGDSYNRLNKLQIFVISLTKACKSNADHWQFSHSISNVLISVLSFKMAMLACIDLTFQIISRFDNTTITFEDMKKSGVFVLLTLHSYVYTCQCDLGKKLAILIYYVHYIII